MFRPIIGCFTCRDDYQYTEDLLALDCCQPQSGKEPVQEKLEGIYSPLFVEEMLAHHPDRCFMEYLLSGIKEGFHIGFNRSGNLLLLRGRICIQYAIILM